MLYAGLPRISTTVKERRLRLSSLCFRSKSEVVGDLVLWEPKHGKRNVGGQAHAFVDLLEEDTGVPRDCLPAAMDDRVGWRKTWTYWSKDFWYRGMLVKGLSEQRHAGQGTFGTEAYWSRNFWYRGMLVKGLLVQRHTGQGTFGTEACWSKDFWYTDILVKGVLVQRHFGQVSFSTEAYQSLDFFLQRHMPVHRLWYRGILVHGLLVQRHGPFGPLGTLAYRSIDSLVYGHGDTQTEMLEARSGTWIDQPANTCAETSTVPLWRT